VEFSDELAKAGFNVTLIEKLPNILNLAFDKELSEKIEVMLVARNVNVITGTGISKVSGPEQWWS
jgi:NADH dehydrogenase FAD-containing subunit